MGGFCPILSSQLDCDILEERIRRDWDRSNPIQKHCPGYNVLHTPLANVEPGPALFWTPCSWFWGWSGQRLQPEVPARHLHRESEILPILQPSDFLAADNHRLGSCWGCKVCAEATTKLRATWRTTSPTSTTTTPLRGVTDGADQQTSQQERKGKLV